MKDGDTIKITDIGTMKVHIVPTPQTRYNENGIQIRRCRSCFSRMARIGHSPRAWRGEEQRLAMIESGELEENTYWCEGIHRPNAPDNSRDIEAHEWVKTETTQQYEDKRDAERAEAAKAAEAQRVIDAATAKAAGMTYGEWQAHRWNERFAHLKCDCKEEGCAECEEE